MDLQCREAAFVVHGGTIMAVLSAFSQTGGDFMTGRSQMAADILQSQRRKAGDRGKQLTEIEKL